MKTEDRFAGRSWLNILAAVTLIAGLIFPIVSGLDWPTFRGVLAWYVLVFILTLVIASAARTQERLARIEHHLGLTETSRTENSEQPDGAVTQEAAQSAAP